MLTYIYKLATDKEKGAFAGIIKLFLYLLSLIYGFIVKIMIFIYRLKPCRLDCKVISVGNITLGGTGKTSLVLLIARYLKENGHKVAVLSRGYKRKAASQGAVVWPPIAKAMSQDAMGDEPYMLKANLKDIPVIVDADRMRSAKQAIADYGVDTVILDDGMQQWRIKKDLEIVTIDATSVFGNGNVIPRGILREPLSSLGRADMFILTKTNLASGGRAAETLLRSIDPKTLIVGSAHLPLNFGVAGKQDEALNLNMFAGKTAVLFSGIAEPDSFENLVNGLGIMVGMHLKFPDHYNYTRQDLDNILRNSRQKNIDIVITTEKDAARIRDLKIPLFLPAGQAGDLRIFYLRIELKITKNEEEFHNRLLGLYSS